MLHLEEITRRVWTTHYRAARTVSFSSQAVETPRSGSRAAWGDLGVWEVLEDLLELERPFGTLESMGTFLSRAGNFGVGRPEAQGGLDGT